MTPALSVVIPVYNMQSTVLHSVCSALDQANVDTEVVVVNDGSTDRSREVVEALQDYRVKVVSQPNGGIASALNAGALAATGRYLYTVGADDWLEKDSVQFAVMTLDSLPEVGFVYGGVQYHGDGTWRYNPPPYTDGYFYHHYSAISSYVFRRGAWLAGCYWRDDTILDWDHVLQLIDRGFCGAAIPVLMFHYWYRQNTGYLADLKANKQTTLEAFKKRWPMITAVDF